MSNEFSCEYAMSSEVAKMCTVAKGPNHGPAPIPEEGKWVQAKQISDISGFTHGVGWCAPQQGACKLTLNVKEGIIEEALKTQPEPLYYSGDGVHPNANGAAFIGQKYAEAVEQLLK